MKKILKYGIFVFLMFIFLTFKVYSVETSKKNFCQETQQYYFQCDDMKVQCTYTKSDGAKAYLNISATGSAKAGEGDGGSNDIKNWGKKDNMSVDAKEIYKSTGRCPTYLMENWGSYYLSDDKHYSNDFIAAGSPGDTYKLISIVYNVYHNEETKKETSKYPNAYSCADFTTEKACKVGMTASGQNFGCTWNKDYKFCSPTGLAYLSCGSGDSIAYDIPVIVPRLISYAIVALKTITPVILIIIGMFQLIKAITSQNDDEMKKAKSSLVKKLIAAVIIFFMVSIVQFVVSKVADDSEQSSLSACMSCFINNDCGKSMYYTDGYGKCYNVSDNKKREQCPVADY